MKAVVIASASVGDYNACRPYLEHTDIWICCDGGLCHAKAMGIKPDYIVGDFDSVPNDLLKEYQSMRIPVKQFPTHKDETDMELGIDLAVELGANDIVMLGGIGSRFDHTLANAHLLLRLLKKGVRGRLVNSQNCVEVIDKPFIVYGKPGDIVSTIPLSMEVTGITLTGFAYPLQDRTLTIYDDLLAVSNVLLEKEGTISLQSGYLYVILSKD